MGGDIASLLLDNTAVNPAAARLLKLTYPDVHFFGCCAHGANLLTRDLLDIGVDGSSRAHALLERLHRLVKATRTPSVRPVYDRQYLSVVQVHLPEDADNGIKPHFSRRMVLNGETRWLTNWCMIRTGESTSTTDVRHSGRVTGGSSIA